MAAFAALFFLLFVLTISCELSLPRQAFADSNDTGVTDSGTCGTCKWTLSNNELVIEPADGVEGWLDEWETVPPWHAAADSIHSAYIVGTVHVKTCNNFFSNCAELNSIDLTGLDTSSCTSFVGMFRYCRGLTSINLSALNTSSAERMGYMFFGCTRFKELDLSTFDTSNLYGMNFMFGECSYLCELNLTGWDASKVRLMAYTFVSCSNLASLDLSEFKTAVVENMTGTFSDCTGLQTINLSGIDSSHVTNMNYLFSSTYNLCTIYDDGDFVVPEGCSTENAFDGMGNVIGGNGTYCYELDLTSNSCFCVDRPGCKGLFTCTHKTLEYVSRQEPVGRAYGSKAHYKCTLCSALSWDDSGKQIITETDLLIFSIPNCKVRFGSTAYEFKASAVSPDPEVFYESRRLVKGRDYTVSYKNNKRLGSATAVIKGIGDYGGTVSKSYKIKAQRVTFKKASVKKAGQVKYLRLKWKKNASKPKRYVIRISNYSDMFRSKTITVKGNKGQANIGVSKSRYNHRMYVQIRAVYKCKGKTYKSAWSKAKSVFVAK